MRPRPSKRKLGGPWHALALIATLALSPAPGHAQEAGKEPIVLDAHRGGAWGVAFLPDGKTALSSGGGFRRGEPVDCDVIVWDLEKRRLIRRLKGHTRPVVGLAVSPDGSLALSGSIDATAQLWEIETGKPLRTLRHDDSVRAVAFSADGRLAITGSDDRTVRAREVGSGRDVGQSLQCRDWVYAVASGGEAPHVIVGSRDQSARWWEVGKANVTWARRATGWVVGVAVTRDGRVAATGGEDERIHIWETATGKEMQTIDAEIGVVTSLAFTPDGKRILAGGDDAVLRLFEVESGKPLARFTGHRDMVNAVAISRDGQKALSGSSDGTIRLWALPR